MTLSRRRSPGRACFSLLLWWAAGGLTVGRLHAAEPPSLALSPSQRAAIARAFAPTLVFHPHENYFPTNSMRLSSSDDDLIIERPENWRARVARYHAMSPTEKLDRAAVAFRVFSRVHRGRPEVVVEYWCYYVYNTFTVLGGWLPYRVADNHPHDLERLYLVLTATQAVSPDDDAADEAWARGAFQIRSVIANAHDGSIPPNEYDARDDESLIPPLTVLVERGSHAMAPDLNRDGRFTPGIDSTKILKLQWGIRDRGSTWGPYRASFMDGRDASALRLCGPAADEAEHDPCTRYTLYPAGDLQLWFAALHLSDLDRREILGSTSWLVRAFGDVRIEKLMVPTDPPDGRELEAMIDRPTADTGLIAGFKSVDHAPAVIVGGRYVWAVPSRHAPDVVAEAMAVFPSGRRRTFEAIVWGSYGVDAITNMLLGAGWFSAGHAMDVVAGVDLRVGRWRVRPSWRVREHAFDSRLMTTF